MHELTSTKKFEMQFTEIVINYKLISLMSMDFNGD